MTEREWDSQDSTRYHDGHEQAEADMRDGRPYDDHAGSKPAPWTEGYRDASAEAADKGEAQEMTVRPMTAEEESEILVRLAQRYAVHNLPQGVRLSEATQAQLVKAIKKGMRNSR